MNYYLAQIKVTSLNFRATSLWLKALLVSYQIKEISLQAYPEVTQLSQCHTRETACWLILSHNACCLSVQPQWQMIPYLEGCCLLLLSNVLATRSLVSGVFRQFVGIAVNCHEPHLHTCTHTKDAKDNKSSSAEEEKKKKKKLSLICTHSIVL